MELDFTNSKEKEQIFDRAIEQLEICKEKMTEIAIPHFHIGNIHMYKQQYENAIEEWNEGLLIEPNYLYMYMNLG